MFDRLQRLHLSEARNIANPDTVQHAACALGFKPTTFAEAFNDPATVQAVVSYSPMFGQNFVQVKLLSLPADRVRFRYSPGHTPNS